MILVTGATGAFGRPLLTELAARGERVVAMARRRPDRLPDGVTFVAADVQDAAAVDAAMAGVARVVHLAWLVGVARDPSEAEAINLAGTRHVLAAAQRHGVEKLVFASSVLAYGPGRDAPLREDDPRRPDPVLQYGDHKRIVEDEVVASGVPAVVVRPAIVIGRAVVASSLQVLAPPALLGVRGEDRPWQFVHQDDVLRFLVDATLGGRTGVVNLAAPGTASLERCAELLDRRVLRAPARLLRGAVDVAWRLRLSEVNGAAIEQLRSWPIADRSRQVDEWGFRCAWSCVDALVDTRRAVCQESVIGDRTRRRRDAPVLPPVGGGTGAPPTAPLRERLAAQGLAGPDVGPLVAAAAATPVPSPDPAVAAAWSAREAAWILANPPAGDAGDDLKRAARRAQLRDAVVDRLALLAACADRAAADEIGAGARDLLAALRAVDDHEEAQRP